MMMFGTKKTKQKNLEQAAGKRSEFGNYARTQSYVHENHAKNIRMWREAVENPLTHQWKIFEVAQQPAPDGGEEPEEIYAYVEDEKGRLLKEADYHTVLENLFLYEKTQTSFGFIPDAEPAIEDMGLDYFRTMAHHDGLAFRKDGSIAAAPNGHITEPGTYSAAERKAVRKCAEQQPPERLLERPSALRALFKQAVIGEHAELVDQESLKQRFERLEDLQSQREAMDIIVKLAKAGTQTIKQLNHHFTEPYEVEFVRLCVVGDDITGKSYNKCPNDPWMDRMPYVTRRKGTTRYVIGPALIEFCADEIEERMQSLSLLDEQTKNNISAYMDRFRIIASMLHAKIMYNYDMYNYETDDTNLRKALKKAFYHETGRLENLMREKGHNADETARVYQEILSPEPVEFSDDILKFAGRIEKVARAVKEHIDAEKRRDRPHWPENANGHTHVKAVKKQPGTSTTQYKY